MLGRDRIAFQAQIGRRMEREMFQQVIKTPQFFGTQYPIQVYKQMLLDAGIVYPLQVLKLPIISSQPRFRHPNQKIANFINEQIEMIWGFHGEDILTALEFGFSAFEKRFEEHNGLIVYKRWISLDPEIISIKTTDDGSFNGFATPFGDIPPYKAFLYSHRKRFENPYGNSRLNAAYRYWLLDKEAYNFQGIAMQHFAMPTIIFKYPPTGEVKVKDERGQEIEMPWADFMRFVADSIYSHAAVGIPATEENIATVEPFVTRQRDLWNFNADHEWLDRKKALAIFCPEDIAVSGQKGSYARAKAQSHWLVRAIEGIKQELALRYLLPYCVKPLLALNFPNEVGGSLSFTPEPLEAEELIKEIILKIDDPNRPPLDWEGIFRSVGLPFKKEQGKSVDFPSVSAALRYLRSKFQESIKNARVAFGLQDYLGLSDAEIKMLEALAFGVFNRFIELEEAERFLRCAAQALVHRVRRQR